MQSERMNQMKTAAPTKLSTLAFNNDELEHIIGCQDKILQLPHKMSEL